MKRAILIVLAVLAVSLGLVSPASATTSTSFPSCTASTQHVVYPLPPGTINSQFKVGSPPSNTTYNLTGVKSTYYPATVSAFTFGTTTPGFNTCVLKGAVFGTVDPTKSWNYYHDNWNASCVKVVGTGWTQVNRLRCDSHEDGIKIEEQNLNSNVDRFKVAKTYLTNIRDDCMENDYTLGGLLYDSLWDGCNTGLSERPSSNNGTWTSPSSETVTLDHMLIGLQKTPHDGEGMGENGLFKWSSSANHLVIKCSLFKVDSMSLNGADAMAIPAGTVVNDSACPNNPTTIVWLGGGSYPGTHPSSIRVVNTLSTWTNAVNNWKAANSY